MRYGSLEKATRKNSQNTKKMYPEKTDQEIVDLIQEEFSKKAREYYWDRDINNW